MQNGGERGQEEKQKEKTLGMVCKVPLSDMVSSVLPEGFECAPKRMLNEFEMFLMLHMYSMLTKIIERSILVVLYVHSYLMPWS